MIFWGEKLMTFKQDHVGLQCKSWGWWIPVLAVPRILDKTPFYSLVYRRRKSLDVCELRSFKAVAIPSFTSIWVLTRATGARLLK